MLYTPEQLDALAQVIGLGAKKVKYGDKEIEYHSLSELRQLMTDMDAQVNGNGTIESRRKQGIHKSTLK